MCGWAVYTWETHRPFTATIVATRDGQQQVQVVELRPGLNVNKPVAFNWLPPIPQPIVRHAPSAVVMPMTQAGVQPQPVAWAWWDWAPWVIVVLLLTIIGMMWWRNHIIATRWDKELEQQKPAPLASGGSHRHKP